MRWLRCWGWFALGFTLVFASCGLLGSHLYRAVVPAWRQVEIDWPDAQAKARFLGSQVVDAEYVILGDSAALRGIDAGCFSSQLGPAVNMSLSSADLASLYSTTSIIRRLGATLDDQQVLLVLYPDFFRAWSESRAESGARLGTTVAGSRHIMRHDAASAIVAARRLWKGIVDASIFRLLPTPVQATNLRYAILGQLPSPENDPSQFKEALMGLCGCDDEILPYRIRQWWVENHRCVSGSEPSFPRRLPPSSYEFLTRNDPVSIPDAYPYTGLADVLGFLSERFSETWLVVLPDRYGYSDLAGFELAMSTAAENGRARLLLLTDLDVSDTFYDEHHATPEGMRQVTQELISRLARAMSHGT